MKRAICKPIAVEYKRDSHVHAPQYQTSGSVAFDIAAAKDVTIAGHRHALIPTGLVVATPQSYALLILARSSLFKKTGCMLANGVGLIDNDYCGDDDEIFVSVWNTREDATEVMEGDRIAQGMFVRMAEAVFEEVNSLSDENRGGFGSTG